MIDRIQSWIYMLTFAVAVLYAWLSDSVPYLEATIALGIAFLLARYRPSEQQPSAQIVELEIQLHETRGALKHVTKFADQETARADKNWQAFCACRDKFVPEHLREGREL